MFLSFERPHDALDIFHGDGVHARERFVEQDELGIDGHCPCYFGTAPFTARQLDTLAFAYFLQAELLDEVFHPFALILLGVVGHFEYRPDVVLDAEVAEDRCLLCKVRLHPSVRACTPAVWLSLPSALRLRGIFVRRWA